MQSIKFDVTFTRSMSEDTDLLPDDVTLTSAYNQIILELEPSKAMDGWEFHPVSAVFSSTGDTYEVFASAEKFAPADADVDLAAELRAFVSKMQAAYDDGAAGFFNVTLINLNDQEYDPQEIATPARRMAM